jgi:hypothetical protein
MKLKILAVGIIFLMLCSIATTVSSIKIISEKDTIKTSILGNDDYIIITSNSFKNYNGENSFHDLCDYHEQNGLNTKIETVENIESSYTGIDRAEKIHNYIKDKSPKYVLLGGDHETIPGRLLQTTYNGFHYNPTPSDVYYSCPDVTWHTATTDLIPNSGDVSVNNPDIPGATLIGEGFLDGNGYETSDGYLRWNYKEGSIEKEGICIITFNEPIDISNMNWLSFNVKTQLREYPHDENGDLPQDILWWSCRVFIGDADGDFDERSLHFYPELLSSGVNNDDWEEVRCSMKLDPAYQDYYDLDYDKIQYIRIRFFRWYEDEDIDDIDPEMDPGDHVLINNFYFYDYDSYSLNKKDGEINPSVCIGRACVDNSEDIQNFVGKTLRYLMSSYPNDGFIENVMLVDNPDDDDDTQGEKKLKEIKNKYLENAGYNCNEYYGGYNKIKAARESLFNNDNTNLLLYTGHGTSSGEGGILTFIRDRDIDNFKNLNPFFEYSVGCWVGNFKKNDCYAEKLTVKTPYGAFAGVWHTRTSWSSYFEGFNKFFKAVCNWDYTIGEAHRYQIQSLDGTGRYTHTLFGDPAVKLKKPTITPEIPDMPSGETNVKTGVEYGYSTKSSDLDGDMIKYGWDWDGDGTVDEWTDFYDSGVTVSTSRSWDEEDVYEIKVKARDEHGAESGWSEPLTVNVEKSKSKTYNSFEKIIENYPLIYQLIQRIQIF